MSAKLKSTLVATWLPPDSYSLLEKQFAEWGVPVPDPELSSVAIVIDSETNELAGFLTAQTTIHLEPIWVDPRYRNNQEVLELLIKQAQSPFEGSGAGFYVFIPDSKIEHLVVRHGMEVLPWKIAVKRFDSAQTETDTEPQMSVEQDRR